MMWLVWLAVCPGLFWCLPGYLWMKRLKPGANPLEYAVWSALFGAATVVPLGYLLSFLVRAPLTPVTVTVAATASGLIALGLPRVSDTEPSSKTPPSESGWMVIALLIVAAAVTFVTSPKAIETTEIWAPCIHESAFLMLEDGSGDGLQVYDPNLDAWISHRTMRPTEPAWGLSAILGHQRPGSMATIAQVVAIHGSAGPVVMTLIDYGLILLGAALLISTFCRSSVMTFLGATAFLLGARHVSVYMVNENMLALALSLGILGIICRSQSNALLLFAGLSFALLIGVRPIAITAVPAALFAIQSGHRNRLLFLVTILIGLIPWLGTHLAVYGQALYHPSLDVPQLEQTFLGISFRFHPLNFPIADEILRPENGLLPLMFSMPLEHTAAFGAIFCVITILGLASTPWKQSLPWVFWGAPTYTLLALIVALDYEKQSYALLAFAPLPIFFGFGANTFLGQRHISTRRKLGAALGAILLLPGLRWAAPDFKLAPDPRPQYVRPTMSSGDARYLAQSRTDAAWEQLLSIDLVPQFNSEDSHSWPLLQRSAPPQLVASEYTMPVMLWRDSDAFRHEFTVATLENRPQNELIAQLGNGCGTRGSVLFVDLEVPIGVGSQVDTIVRLDDRHTLVIELTTKVLSDNSTSRITLGVHDTALDVIRTVRVLWNGKSLDTKALVMESIHSQKRPERTLRIVSTSTWQPMLKNGTVQLTLSESYAACQSISGRNETIQIGPGFAQISSPRQSCRLRAVNETPPTTFVNPCP